MNETKKQKLIGCDVPTMAMAKSKKTTIKTFLAISDFGTWGRGNTREEAIKKMCWYNSRSKTSYHLYETDDTTVEVDKMGTILTERDCYLHKIEVKEKGKASVRFDWAAADEAEKKYVAELTEKRLAAEAAAKAGQQS